LEQTRLADRGVPIMVLQYLAAADGVPGDMVAKTLQLGIKALNGGNKKTQTVSRFVLPKQIYSFCILN
jgi:hypothetical protein